MEVPEEWLQGIETGWLESKSSRAGTADKGDTGRGRQHEVAPGEKDGEGAAGGESSAIHGRHKGAGRTGERRSEKDEAVSGSDDGLDRRRHGDGESVRGGATHLPKPAEVGTWDLACRATVQEENPEGHLSGRRQGGPVCASAGVEERIFCGPGVGPEMKMFAVARWCRFFSSRVVDRESRGSLNANGACRRLLIVERGGAISESVKTIIKGVCGASCSPKKHGHEEFRPQWRTFETVDDAVGSPSLPPASAVVCSGSNRSSRSTSSSSSDGSSDRSGSGSSSSSSGGGSSSSSSSSSFFMRP